MELWVLAQNKKSIVKANNIFIDYDFDYTNKCNDYNICVNEEGNIVGTYYSETRAMEIITEIRNILIGLITEDDIKTYAKAYDYMGLKNYTGLAIEGNEARNFIYEMPEE